MIKVTDLQTQSEALNTQLKQTLSAYKSNQQSGLQTSQALENAQKQLAQLKRDTAGLHYSIKLAKERNTLIRNELSASKEQLGNTHQKLKATQEQAVKDQTKLSALEQQLIAQKETVESISKAFIELRKQLLSAKSNNETIDPNKNAHIDRIARLLGHY
jgi:chromosome segregation ATPase